MSFVDEASGATTAVPDAPTKWSREPSSPPSSVVDLNERRQRGHTDPADAPGRGPERRLERALRLIVGVVVVSALVLRFLATGPLWLDEAQSVSIARLPFSSMFDALRHDGAPPFYYMVLHGWMKVFGEDPNQVRALSAVLSVATVPLVWHLGCRFGRKEVGDCAVVLFVTSPFAVRYASEARMYSLVMLLVCAGALLILRARRAPTLFNLACVAAVTCLLLLTHYWAIYLVTATIGGLVWRYWAKRDRTLGRLVVSILAGVVASLWWAPTFLYQLRRTGAPWANRPTVANLLDSLGSYAGRRDTVGTLLCLLLIGFLAIGVVAHRAAGGPVELGWARPSASRSLTLLAGAVLMMALGAGMVVGAPVPARYTSVVFPLLLLAAATGVGLLHPTTRRSFLVVIAILGFIGSIPAATASRTEAGSIAAVLETRVAPSDLIVYCPDQLAPAVTRLIPSTLNQLTFPDLAPPHLVDWVDYRSRVAQADPVAFADAVDRLAGDNDIWLIVAPSYVAVGGPCREVQLALERSRWSSTVASYSPGEREGSTLERLRPMMRFHP